MDPELLAIFRESTGDSVKAVHDLVDLAPETWDIDELFRVVHSVKGDSKMVGLQMLTNVAHALEEILGEVRSNRELLDQYSELVRRGCQTLEQVFHDESSITEDALFPLLDAAAEITSNQAGPGPNEPASPETSDEERPVDAISGEQVGPDTGDSSTSRPAGTDAIRVSRDRVDAVIQLAAEVELIRSRSSEILENAEAHRETLYRSALGTRGESLVLATADELVADLVRLDHALGVVAEDIAYHGLRLRMVRFGSVSSYFRSVALSAAESTGKQVRFETAGDDVELDRLLLDTIRDPLTHLVRNAVAHGIEAPDDREAAGKDSTGTITLSLSIVGRELHIDVTDDGKGINIDQLVEGGADPDNWQQHILRPGFSTAESTTELAGRGVGLDVVNKNVQSIGGSIDIKSEFGHGAIFSMRLPSSRLTTATLNVRIDSRSYFLPLSQVVTTLDLGLSDRDNAITGSEVQYFDGYARRISFASNGSPGPAGRSGRYVVIRNGRKVAALSVDEILNADTVVIRNLPDGIGFCPAVSGTVIQGDGDIGWVLDPAVLVDSESNLQVSGSPDAGGKSISVLVVDDSVTSRTLVATILESRGYRTTVAVDGEEGWARICEGQFDIVLSDVEMPRLTGLELVQRVRSSAEYRKLPVVLLTSLGSIDQRNEGARAGADAYLVKGEFKNQDLLDTVQRLAEA